MVTLKRFIYPSTLEEALAALAAGRDNARAIAGGTSLIFFHGKGTDTLVDITRLGLSEIRGEAGGLIIGACARLQSLAESPLLADPGLLALAEAAGVAGPRAVRNAITLGGNLAGYKRWSDTPVPLMALGAVCAVAGPESRDIAVVDLMRKHPQTQLQPGELITQIRVPAPPAGAGSAYVKIGRTVIDYALVSAAARVVLDDAGRCADASLALGAVRPLPEMIAWIGEALRGKVLKSDVLNGVAERLQSEITPAADMRASTEYLATLTGIAARDALAKANRRARGEESNA